MAAGGVAPEYPVAVGVCRGQAVAGVSRQLAPRHVEPVGRAITTDPIWRSLTGYFRAGGGGLWQASIHSEIVLVPLCVRLL